MIYTHTEAIGDLTLEHDAEMAVLSATPLNHNRFRGVFHILS